MTLSKREQGLQNQNSNEGQQRSSPATNCSTSAIFDQLNIAPPDIIHAQTDPLNLKEESSPSNLEISFVYIPSASSQPATIRESDLIYFLNSDELKSGFGTRASAHKTDIVSYPDGPCDFLIFFHTSYDDLNYNDIPGKGKYAYVLTKDQQFVYLDKHRKLKTKINLEETKLRELYQQFPAKLFEKNQELSYCIKIITLEDIKKIAKITGHIHCMAWLKRYTKDSIMYPSDSVMPSIEAAIDTVYQLEAGRNFPTGLTVRNSLDQDIGMISKDLPGFIPNRKKPLKTKDLVINSLENMIRKRSKKEEKEIQEVLNIVNDLIPYLDRNPPDNANFFKKAVIHLKNCGHSLLGNQYSAINIIDYFQTLANKNAPTITFGELEALRNLLINRKQAIAPQSEETWWLSKTLSFLSYYVTDPHNHDEELKKISNAIDKLEFILLDETALYMKHLRKIDKELRDNWIDIEEEKLKPNSKFSMIPIEDGLLERVYIRLEDVEKFRIHCNQAMSLTTRYFRMDDDVHSQNHAADGKSIDGGNGVTEFTHRYVSPNRKKSTFPYTVQGFHGFPNSPQADIWYWPTISQLSDHSADAILSLTSEATKNYFSPIDNENYKNIADSPVFCFQKYVQFIIECLLNKKIFEACATIHINDNLPIIKEDGNPNILLPLYDSNGKKQDARSKFVDCLTDRQEQALELSLHLSPLKNILQYHSELVLECILDNFRSFLEDRRAELNEDAIAILDEAIKLDEIEKSFYEFKEKIIHFDPAEIDTFKDSLVINLNASEPNIEALCRSNPF